MAIRKRANSYQVYWNNPFTGKRESCTVPTLQEAKKKDALIKYQLEYERTLFQRENSTTTKEKENAPTWNDLAKLFLAERLTTPKNLVNQVGKIRSFLDLFGDRPAAELTAEDLQALYLAEKSKPVVDTTVNYRMRYVKGFIRWAVENGYLDKIPKLPKLPPAYTQEFVPPTTEEIEAMLAAAPKHLRRVIILGTQCGMRIGPCELFKLQWQDVDLSGLVIHLRAARKNLKEPVRDIPIRKELASLMAIWKAEDAKKGVGYVINYGGHQVSSVKSAWAKTLKRAGITRHIRPYDLRHAFATEAIAAGADVGTVAKLMGHASPVMVLTHYQHVLDRQKKEAVESLPMPSALSMDVPDGMCQQ